MFLSLQSWERNVGSRLVKAPKIHYLGSGVPQAVLRKRGGITGPEFESLAVAGIYKQAMALPANASKEVGWLAELPGGCFRFPACWTSR